jgi:hypothetical protein
VTQAPRRVGLVPAPASRLLGEEPYYIPGDDRVDLVRRLGDDSALCQLAIPACPR